MAFYISLNCFVRVCVAAFRLNQRCVFRYASRVPAVCKCVRLGLLHVRVSARVSCEGDVAWRSLLSDPTSRPVLWCEGHCQETTTRQHRYSCPRCSFSSVAHAQMHPCFLYTDTLGWGKPPPPKKKKKTMATACLVTVNWRLVRWRFEQLKRWELRVYFVFFIRSTAAPTARGWTIDTNCTHNLFRIQLILWDVISCHDRNSDALKKKKKKSRF